MQRTGYDCKSGKNIVNLYQYRKNCTTGFPAAGKEKNMTFVNFTNHPAATWSDVQLAAAEKYGEIVELPFPVVHSTSSEKDITALADELADKIMAMDPAAVMCQGEFTLAYAVIRRLRSNGIKVVAACSERMVEMNEEGKKVVTFHFEQFREYE